MYVSRRIERPLRSAIRHFAAVVLTGPRQSGKSTLLKEKFPRYRYATLDDPVLREQAREDPNLFLDSLGPRAIVDEIQYAPEILSYMKMRIDEDRQRTGQFILTGSQQFSMMKGLSDSLAGRLAVLNLAPFDVREKANVRRLEKRMATTLGAFVDAALRGSYPELCVRAGLDARTWWASYLQTYLERDVRSISNIGDLRDFQRFLQLLAARCAQPLKMSSFAQDIGVSVPTIKRWISILQTSMVIYLLPPYYQNFGKRITKSPKVYFLDIGLAAYLTGISTKEHLLNGPLAGALFENFCVQETVKLFLHEGETPRLYYVRTHNGLEVDLLIEGAGLSLILVEIKLSKTPNRNMAAGIRRFRETFSRLDVRESYLLSLAEERKTLDRQTSVLPFFDYVKKIEKLCL